MPRHAPEPAALSASTSDAIGYNGPVASAIELDKLREQPVLLSHTQATHTRCLPFCTPCLASVSHRMYVCICCDDAGRLGWVDCGRLVLAVDIRHLAHLWRPGALLDVLLIT